MQCEVIAFADGRRAHGPPERKRHDMNQGECLNAAAMELWRIPVSEQVFDKSKNRADLGDQLFWLSPKTPETPRFLRVLGQRDNLLSF